MRALLLVALVALSHVALAEECPADFDAFISAFQDNVDFQEAHTRYPLTYGYVDNGRDGPKRVEVRVSKDRVTEFPGTRYLSAEVRVRVPMQRRISSPDAATRTVTLYKEDTDYQIDYIFKSGTDCWELVAVESHSL